MESKTQHYFFFGLMIAALVLTFLIFLPYLTALILALVFSVLFRPLHRFVARIVSKGRESSSLASIVTLIIIALLIITPLLFVAGKIYVEIQDVYVYLTNEAERSRIIVALDSISDKFSSSLFGVSPAYSFESFNVTEYLQQGLEWAFSNLDTLFSGFAKVAVNVFILLFALYYMLRDGRAFKRNLIMFSPLVDSYDERIFDKLENAIHSVIKGSLVVGLIQGILTGIGFYIFGVPNPALWGSVAAVAALIPGVGTSLVVVPGILFLFFSGTTGMAIGLTIWGLIAVGLIDNFLGPRLIEKGVRIHQFLILLSVLGGLTFFGPIGFILGPLILALLFALLEIYKDATSRKISA
jgi:predicted PurR-regulated permease PerM